MSNESNVHNWHQAKTIKNAYMRKSVFTSLENTKAIICVDLGGIPCDYDKIFQIVNDKKGLFKPSNSI